MRPCSGWAAPTRSRPRARARRRRRASTRRQRTVDAVAVADEIGLTAWAQALTAEEQTELKGAVTILTLQLEAFAIHLRGGDGVRQPQVKNNTPALSRVTLHEIHASLSAPVRQAMHDNHEAIINAIATQLDGVADYNDSDFRQVDGLDPVTLGAYAASGLGRGDEVSQQQVFGGMNEIPLDQSHNMALVPVELRSFRQQYMSFDEVRAAGADLVRQSRALLLPQPAQAQGGQAQAQPLAPIVHQAVGAALVLPAFVPGEEHPHKRRKL